MATETYLGAGVWVSCDGFQVKLRSPRDNMKVSHEVYLPPEVMSNFRAFLAHLEKKELSLG